MESTRGFSALYVRDYRLFWIGQVISLSGTWMHAVAQSWLVYTLTHSALYLGIVASLSSLPILLFTLVGGTIADRYPKRNILLVTQALSMLSALTVGILADLGIITVWQICAIAFFLGTVNAFDVPTRQSFLTETAGRGEITSAIALNSAAFNGARIVGPVLAGILMATLGIPACFYLNALSFVPVIVFLMMIKARGVPGSRPARIIEEIAGGWQFARRERRVFWILSLISLFSLFGIPYVTLLPILAEEVLHSGARGLSLLMAAGGAGSFLAAFMLALRGEIDSCRRDLPVAALVFSFGLLSLSFSSDLPVSLFIIFCAGWGITRFLAMSNSYIQHSVPDSLRGRTMGLYTLVFLGLAPIGNAVIGFAADAFGTVASLKMFALTCIAGSAVFLRAFRQDRA